MISVARKFWGFIEGINGLLLILYSIFVFVTFVFVAENDLKYFPRWCFLIVILSVALCPMLLRAVRRLDTDRWMTRTEGVKSNEIRWRIIFFAVPLVFFLVKYVIHYPGAMTNDSFKQYGQVLTGRYNDWHPVLQTLFSFRLPLTLTRGWIGSISLFQVFVFSFSLTHMLLSVRKYMNNRVALIMTLFVLLNPETTNIALFPWKDVPFAIGAMLLMTFVLHIWFTEGEWIRKPWHLIAFVVVWVCTTLFRHNALLFTVPLLVILFFLIAKKTAIILCACVGVLVAGIKFPLYSALRVENPGKRQVETLGLPMTVIGAAVTYAPEKLDDEVLEFAYQVAPREVWEKEYKYGEYNDVKWDALTNNEVIEEYGTGRILGLMIRCFRQAPVESLKGFIKLTETVYSICDDYKYMDIPVIGQNEYGIYQQGIPALQNVNEKVTRAVFNLFPRSFMYIGSMHLILLIVILAKCKLNKWKDWKKILMVLPMFAYNFGTALLLTGASDSSRFFFYTFLLTPILLVILLVNKKERTAAAA